MYNRVTFAARLFNLRTEKNLSLAELGRQLGVSSVSLGYYERRERVPDIETLCLMCQYFSVTSDYLLGLTNNRTPEAASIGEITGLSDKAIAALRCFNVCYNETDNENILPLVNHLLASEMSPAHAALMYNRLEQESTEETPADAYPKNVIKTSTGEVLLNANIIRAYEKLCGKPLKGYPVLTEMLKYFNAAGDGNIYLTDKGELCNKDDLSTAEGKVHYEYKVSELVEQMLLSNIQKSLQTHKEGWQTQDETENDIE